MKSICFVFNKAPYGNNSGRELLDICLMASAFEMPITAIFTGEGVYQLLKEQKPEVLKLKNHSMTFKALELYGVEKILVNKDSLEDLGLSEENCLEIAEPVHSDAIKCAIQNHDFTLSL